MHSLKVKEKKEEEAASQQTLNHLIKDQKKYDSKKPKTDSG